MGIYDANQHRMTGLDCCGRSQWREAIPHFTAAIKASPDLFTLEDFSAATVAADPALRLAVAIYNDRGGCYSYLGDFPKAASDHAVAVALAPSVEPFRQNLANLSKKWAQQCCQEGSFKQGTVLFTRAIGLGYGDASCHFNRGLAYAKIRRYTSCVEDWKKSYELGNRSIAQKLADMEASLAGQGPRDYGTLVSTLPKSALSNFVPAPTLIAKFPLVSCEHLAVLIGTSLAAAKQSNVEPGEALDSLCGACEKGTVLVEESGQEYRVLSEA